MGDKNTASDVRDAAEETIGGGRTYRVAGPHPVHDTLPGCMFTKELDPTQEEFLLRLGHIEIVEASDSEPDSATDSADGAEHEGD